MLKDIYEINSETCALVPNSNLSTVIIEKESSFIIPLPVSKVINYNCAYYGSSFEGRLKGSKYALGSKYKLPIIIEESKELIFFPTSSFENPNCVWISLNNISDYQKSQDATIVKFNNKQKIDLKISYESFENQVLRATKLLLILKSRKNC